MKSVDKRRSNVVTAENLLSYLCLNLSKWSQKSVIAEEVQKKKGMESLDSHISIAIDIAPIS